MPINSAINERWVDVIPPAAPQASGQPLVLWVGVLVLTLLVAVAVVYYRHPRQRAARTLRRLARELKASRTESKQACFQLVGHLRRALATVHLHSVRFPPARQADWQAFQQTITRYCFAAEDPTVAEVDSAIGEALAWIRTAAVKA